MIYSDYSVVSSLRTVDYIILNSKPHKTVLNMSFGSLEIYRKFYDDKIFQI